MIDSLRFSKVIQKKCVETAESSPFLVAPSQGSVMIIVITLLVVLTTILAAGGAFMFNKKRSKKKENKQPKPATNRSHQADGGTVSPQQDRAMQADGDAAAGSRGQPSSQNDMARGDAIPGSAPGGTDAHPGVTRNGDTDDEHPAHDTGGARPGGAGTGAGANPVSDNQEGVGIDAAQKHVGAAINMQRKNTTKTPEADDKVARASDRSDTATEKPDAANPVSDNQEGVGRDAAESTTKKHAADLKVNAGEGVSA
jgi:hypothetical protein